MFIIFVVAMTIFIFGSVSLTSLQIPLTGHAYQRRFVGKAVKHGGLRGLMTQTTRNTEQEVSYMYKHFSHNLSSLSNVYCSFLMTFLMLLLTLKYEQSLSSKAFCNLRLSAL